MARRRPGGEGRRAAVGHGIFTTSSASSSEYRSFRIAYSVSLHGARVVFAVTDALPVVRRAPVATTAGVACHHRLEAHGGARNTVEYCAFCHNPQKANDQRVARFEGTAEPPGNDPNTFCDSPFLAVSSTRRIPPATATCTGCHDAPSTAVHAEVMTSAAGEESCATCHGPGSAFDAGRAHQLPP